MQRRPNLATMTGSVAADRLLPLALLARRVERPIDRLGFMSVGLDMKVTFR